MYQLNGTPIGSFEVFGNSIFHLLSGEADLHYLDPIALPSFREKYKVSNQCVFFGHHC